MKLLKIFLIIVCFLLITTGIIYFTVISPAFVSKPKLEKPEIKMVSLNNNTENNSDSTEIIIEDEHIEYIVTEIGGYKLHNDPINNQEPIIKFQLSDSKREFFVKILDNTPEVFFPENNNESVIDLIIKSTEPQVVEIFESDDFNKKVVEMVKLGKINVEIISDEKTLALKGYKAVYDELMGDSGMPTGQFVKEFDSKLVWT